MYLEIKCPHIKLYDTCLFADSLSPTFAATKCGQYHSSSSERSDINYSTVLVFQAVISLTVFLPVQ